MGLPSGQEERSFQPDAPRASRRGAVPAQILPPRNFEPLEESTPHPTRPAGRKNKR
jgi:hypothetical protein